MNPNVPNLLKRRNIMAIRGVSVLYAVLVCWRSDFFSNSSGFEVLPFLLALVGSYFILSLSLHSFLAWVFTLVEVAVHKDAVRKEFLNMKAFVVAAIFSKLGMITAIVVPIVGFNILFVPIAILFAVFFVFAFNATMSAYLDHLKVAKKAKQESGA